MSGSGAISTHSSESEEETEQQILLELLLCVTEAARFASKNPSSTDRLELYRKIRSYISKLPEEDHISEDLSTQDQETEGGHQCPKCNKIIKRSCDMR
jgi:hypothetical protein